MTMPYATDVQARKRKQRRGTVVLVVLVGLILTVLLISLNTGYIRIMPDDVVRTVFGYGTAQQELILYKFRLPRMTLTLFIGAGLAVSGCIMQGISRNDLADPGIMGINAGAGLMVMLYISFFPTPTDAPIFFLPLLAFAGAACAAILIYALAYSRREGMLPIRLLLTGIAVAAGISAAMIVLTLRLDPNKYQFLSAWLAGSIWGVSWKFVLALLPWLVVLLPYVFFKARVLNVLNLGETTATGLGARVGREQLKLMAAGVALAGSCVAVSGGIGFVGLLGPHLARRLVGNWHQWVIPVSALLGALLVLSADLIGRLLLQPQEIPAGIVVAVIGAPYFIYLLLRAKA